MSDSAATLNQAIALMEESGDPASASVVCRQILARDLNFLPAWIVLAAALLAAGQTAAALAAADAALALAPASTPALFIRGTALNLLRRPEEAAAALARASEDAPNHAGAWLNLGIALTALDRHEEAEAAIRRALALNPDAAPAWASLGALLVQALRIAEALAAYDNSVRLDPEAAAFRHDRALTHLRAGNFAAGWEGLRSRKPEEERVLARMGVHGAEWGPEWDGEEIAGRTLLLCATQGLGDAIQFARYIPLLARAGARTVLCCHPSLHRLLSGVEGLAATIAPGDPLPPHDGWASLMSLPRLFATTARTIPFAAGYLAADPVRVAAWRAHLGPGPGRKRTIGLVWAGNPDHVNDARRSMPPAALAPILAAPGLRFASLQPGADPAWLGIPVLDLAQRPTDFAETAAALFALDLLITVDTASAHLAGALGRPAWVALPYAPDWRWQTARSDSPWYASLRLFRQPRPGDWASVAAAISASLATGPAA